LWWKLLLLFLLSETLAVPGFFCHKAQNNNVLNHANEWNLLHDFKMPKRNVSVAQTYRRLTNSYAAAAGG